MRKLRAPLVSPPAPRGGCRDLQSSPRCGPALLPVGGGRGKGASRSSYWLSRASRRAAPEAACGRRPLGGGDFERRRAQHGGGGGGPAAGPAPPGERGAAATLSSRILSLPRALLPLTPPLPQVLGWRLAAAVAWSVLLLPVCTAAFVLLSGVQPLRPLRWLSGTCPALPCPARVLPQASSAAGLPSWACLLLQSSEG